MREIMLTLGLLALTAGSVVAQQAAVPGQPDQADMKNGANGQENASQLSEKDRPLACSAKSKSSPDVRTILKAGGSVSPPHLTNQVAATFSEEARKMFKKKHLKSFNAVSIVAVVVDEEGSPRDICVQRPAGYGLDGHAVDAVGQYRFQPATKDGMPVAVQILVEVDFREY